MRSPQDEQPTNGVAHAKENKQVYRLFVEGKEVELFDASNYMDYHLSNLPERNGNFSKTITLDPFSPTFITDYYTYIKK